MKAKTKLITILAIVSIAVTISSIPAMAGGLKWTKTVINWHVLGADEIRVTILSDTAPGTIANSSGNWSTVSLNFTCAIKDCQWVNVSTESATPTYQTQTVPALKIENLGTTTASWINLSVNYTWAAGDCFKLFYTKNQTGGSPVQLPDGAVPTIASAQNLTITNVTLSSNFAPNADPIHVWLFGNFSNCLSQNNQTNLYVFAYT